MVRIKRHCEVRNKFLSLLAAVVPSLAMAVQGVKSADESGLYHLLFQ